MNKLFALAFASLAFGASSSDAANFRLAPIKETLHPVTDESGRIKYLIDLAPGVLDQFPEQVTADVAKRYGGRHQGRAKNMARALEKQFGFRIVDMTSWVGPSVSAYLTIEEAERVRADPRVILVTENSTTTNDFSAPPWADQSPVSPPNPASYEMRSYGHVAMNGQFSVGSGYPRIYVVDNGVGFHSDVPNVTRVSPSGANPVGCYAHGTHVASIINATYGNFGTVGILPGVPITSVSVLNGNLGAAACGSPYARDETSIAAALDWVKWDLRMSGEYRAGIVNISMNGASFGPGGTLRAKIADIAAPYVGGYVYLGAFVVESAGNQSQDACNVAYGPAATNDGIMVVGAVAASGQNVNVFNEGFNNGSTEVPYEPGSNWGSCVEAWAPGQYIWGAWGPHSFDPNNPATWQDGATTYNNYVRLGGTSMAAPHVVAVAAYLAATQGLRSGSEIETAVRNTFYTANWVEPGGSLIQYPRIP